MSVNIIATKYAQIYIELYHFNTDVIFAPFITEEIWGKVQLFNEIGCNSGNNATWKEAWHCHLLSFVGYYKRREIGQQPQESI